MDFSFTDADNPTAAPAREEVDRVGAPAPRYEEHEDELQPKVSDQGQGLSGSVGRTDSLVSATSGRVIVEHLVTMEMA